MIPVPLDRPMITEGTLSFSVESRVLRELGERLVKQAEVAVVELVKNAYDADATECTIDVDGATSITVADDGAGMTLQQFTDGWMRIGTSSKELSVLSSRFMRVITGEKGIGRFAVRFLGQGLQLESTADDPERNVRTRLTADFDWPDFDRNEDLGSIEVPYQLYEAGDDAPTGTTLVITRLRSEVDHLDLQAVRTGAIGVLTPLRSLFRKTGNRQGRELVGHGEDSDPGFILKVKQDTEESDADDVAAQILDAFVLRAELAVRSNRVELQIYRRGSDEPSLSVVDTYENEIARLDADIRFFPRRVGTFTNMPVDGHKAQGWIKTNHGVAVFDRDFRVPPYGYPRDDWLQLQTDAASNRRDPRSTLASKHFAMTPAVKGAPALNWMLRLPQSLQLVGLVQVRGRRPGGDTPEPAGEGLVASADREGFVENRAFAQMQDLVRGAVEGIAYVDRMLQQEEEEAERERVARTLQEQTRAAIAEVQANPEIKTAHKARIVSALTETGRMAELQREASKEREQQLEVMSLLGIVAGFMTHEFGIALQELEGTHEDLVKLAGDRPEFRPAADGFAKHIRKLKEFVTYSSGYIHGARTVPEKSYPARPRLAQVRRIFGKYAEERDIEIELTVERNLPAPLVPVSLYNGLALNLYTNALKAVTAKAGEDRGKIAFRAWNEGRWHYLEVSDTGIGIPAALHEQVFDPLFTTTTKSHKDPLGSGMGLGLSLVRRGAEAYGGRVELMNPPSGFATCIRVRLPMPATEE